MKEKKVRYVSMAEEVHDEFRIYCALKRISQIELNTKLIVEEMIRNGFKFSFDADKYIKSKVA